MASSVRSAGVGTPSALSAADEWPQDARVRFGAWSPVKTDLPRTSVVSIAAAGGRLYALGSVGSVYESQDNGVSWQQISYIRQGRPLPLKQLVALPSTQDEPAVFLATSAISSAELYRTSGGVTRQVILGNPSRPWESAVQRLRVVGDSIYAAAELGLYRSDDRGQTWIQVLATPSRCFDVVSAGDHVYASCLGIYRSVAGGAFELVANAPEVRYAQLAVSPTSPNIVYATTSGYGIYRSSDSAGTWEQTLDFNDGDPMHASLYGDLEATCGEEWASSGAVTFAVDPKSPAVVWIGRGQLFRSDDRAHTFGRASVRLGDSADVHALPGEISALLFDASGLWVATARGSYYTSSRGAAVQRGGADVCTRLAETPDVEWTERNEGINGRQFAEVAVTGDGSVLATTATEGGIYYSNLDSLSTWDRIFTTGVRGLAVDPAGGIDRFYTADCALGGVPCKFDSSSHWAPQAVGGYGYGGITFIAPEPGSRDRVWAGIGSGIYRSDNGLVTGTFVGYTQGCPGDGAVSPANASIVLIINSCGKLLRRDDALALTGEVEWPAQQLKSSGSSFLRVKFDPLHPSRAYVTDYTEPSIFLSTDTGLTWKSLDANGDADGLPSRHVQAVASDPEIADVIYIGTEQGDLYVSWDGGSTAARTWHRVPTPFNGAPIQQIVSRSDASGGRRLFVFTAGAGVWTVVPELPEFADVPFDHWAYDYVKRLYKAGVTTGCASSPLLYCPGQAVTRDQMAVFLLRAGQGSTYRPPVASGVFVDVPSTHWAASWIEQLRSSGITSGCSVSPPKYCPDGEVTRDQMAVFLVRAKYGAGFAPPPATGVFQDVPRDHWAAAWIEQLARDGVTAGCSTSPRLYCPDNVVTRDQMAVFLVRNFAL